MPTPGAATKTLPWPKFENEASPSKLSVAETPIAPGCAAQMIPFATPASDPDPLELRTFTGMIGDETATPLTPTPLFVEAAAMPATCVPWPWSSKAKLEAQFVVHQSEQSAPRSVLTFAERSAWPEL